ncbi:MAG: putative Histidine kinase [Promethearchaeota archaeon]|nr:MAG: putative Histidine kinase [Candidatus Lokiarchaeota archaeon]
MISKEINEDRELLANIVREFTIPTFILDINHNVIEWNKALEGFTKIKREVILGTDTHWKAFYTQKRPTLADLLLDGRVDQLDQYYTTFSKAEYNNGAYRAESWVHIASEKKYILFSAILIEDSNGKITHAVETIENITERERLQERNNFLNSLYRHDAGNMINVCQGYLNLLLETPLSKKQLTFVNEALKAAQGVVSIIQKADTLNRIQKERVKELALDDLISEVVKIYKTQAKKKGIEIQVSLPEIKYIVKGGNLLEELFVNLVQNSIQHSNGTLIKITGKESNHEIIISIEDDGIGIKDSDKKKIFDKGFKKGQNAGAGLGLFLVKSIAENYKGNVEVTDSKLGGARFNIRLKIVKDDLDENKCLILVVDDNQSFLKYIKILLENNNFMVKTASDALKALDYLNNQNLERIPDLIISDIRMPEMSGYEFFKAISLNQNLNRIPFIFLSGLSSEKDIRLGKILGADDYITKPVDQKDILATIKGKLRKRKRELRFMTEIDESLPKNLPLTQISAKEKQNNRANEASLESEDLIRQNSDDKNQKLDIVLFLVFWDDKTGPKLIKCFPERAISLSSAQKLGTQIFQGVVPIYGQEQKIGNAEDLLFKLGNIERHAYVYFDAFPDRSKRSKQTEYMLAVIAPDISYFDSLQLKRVFEKMSKSVKKTKDIMFNHYFEDVEKILKDKFEI